MVDSLGSETSRVSWYSLTLFWVFWSAFGDLGPVVGGKGATASAWRLEIDGDETTGVCNLQLDHKIGCKTFYPKQHLPLFT